MLAVLFIGMLCRCSLMLLAERWKLFPSSPRKRKETWYSKSFTFISIRFSGSAHHPSPSDVLWHVWRRCLQKAAIKSYSNEVCRLLLKSFAPCFMSFQEILTYYIFKHSIQYYIFQVILEKLFYMYYYFLLNNNLLNEL